MNSSQPHQPEGLKTTKRQLWILLLFAVLWILIYAKLTEIHQRTGLINAKPLAVLYTPWLLGVLVILIDRPGPVRNWLGPLLISVFYPTLCLWYDFDASSKWMHHGTAPTWFLLIPMNILVFGGFAVYLARMSPKRCPTCERRALIPLLRLLKQDRRTVNTHWCAACGAKLWKDQEGQWQREKRRTYLDNATVPADAARIGRIETT